MIEVSRSQELKAMIESHFGFRETPFGVTPDPRFFFQSPSLPRGFGGACSRN